MQTVTFSATSTNVTTGYTKIEASYDETNSGNSAQGIVGIKCFARATHSGITTFTLEMALRRNVDGVVIARVQGTGTATARRSDNAGTGGEYICGIVWTTTGTEFFDLGGGTEPQQGGLKSTGYSWYMGLTANTAGTLNAANPLIVEVHPIRTV